MKILKKIFISNLPDSPVIMLRSGRPPNEKSYILGFEVSDAGLLVVSTGFLVVSTGAVTVVSFLVSFLLPELLQATKEAAMNAIAKNFFMCCDFFVFNFKIIPSLYSKTEKVTRFFIFFWFVQGYYF